MTAKDLENVEEGKFLYKLPTNLQNYTNRVDLMNDGAIGKKHKVIRIKQLLLNKKHGDKRQLRNIVQHTSSLGRTYLFGDYGHGKNAVMVTIGEVLGNSWLLMDLD